MGDDGFAIANAVEYVIFSRYHRSVTKFPPIALTLFLTIQRDRDQDCPLTPPGATCPSPALQVGTKHVALSPSLLSTTTLAAAPLRPPTRAQRHPRAWPYLNSGTPLHQSRRSPARIGPRLRPSVALPMSAHPRPRRPCYLEGSPSAAGHLWPHGCPSTAWAWIWV